MRIDELATRLRAFAKPVATNDLWAIAVGAYDATVVRMYGPIDVDSLEFQTRVQILQISELTGVSRHQVVTRAIEELYRRVIAAATDEQLAARHRPAAPPGR